MGTAAARAVGPLREGARRWSALCRTTQPGLRPTARGAGCFPISNPGILKPENLEIRNLENSGHYPRSVILSHAKDPNGWCTSVLSLGFLRTAQDDGTKDRD